MLRETAHLTSQDDKKATWETNLLDQAQLDLIERESILATQRKISSLQSDLTNLSLENSSLKKNLEDKSLELSTTRGECSHLGNKIKGYLLTKSVIPATLN
jgi:hypothetical protein